MPNFALSRIDVGNLIESPEVAELLFAFNMTVYINGEFEARSGEEGPEGDRFGEGFYFEAEDGATIRIVVDNENLSDPQVGSNAFLDPIWLISETTSRKLTDGVPEAFYEWGEIVFDQTFSIVFQPGLEDDEQERVDKRRRPCDPPCIAGKVTQAALNAAAPLTYHGSNAAQAPGSMGYGWSMGILQACLEFPVSGDLVFSDGSGSFQRWVLDDDVYLPAHPDNYIVAEENLDDSFTLTFRDQTKMNFNSDGELETIVDRNGNTSTFTRDGNGHVTSVEDEEGRGLYVDYDGRTDGQPRYLRREDPSTGLETELIYDGNDRLWKVIDPEGETTEFLYNGDGLLWKKLDPRGEIEVEYTYYDSGDDEGKLETETRYGEHLITYTYGEDTVTIVEEDLSPLTDDEPRTTIFTYRERRQLVSKEDPLGNIWSWEYKDPFNPYLVTKIINPNLNTTVFTYTEDGLLESVTDAQGNTTTYTYNQPGDLDFTEAKRFLIKEFQRPTVTVDGNPVDYAPTKFYYDELGNLTKIEDALGNSTVFEVGEYGRIDSVTDRRLNVFSFVYSEETGGLNAGNVSSVTAPAGPNSAPARVTRYTYDAYDRVTEVEDHGTHTAQFQLDGNDRVTRQTDPRGKYADFNFVDGRLDNINLPTNQGSGANRRQTTFLHDESGRILEVIGKTGTSTEIMRVRNEYDGFSNLRKLARLKDSLEVIHEFNVDKLDRVLSAIDPLLRETEVAHEPFCLERTVTTPRGIETHYRFDSLCRLHQVESQRELVIYSYDELGRLVSVSQDSHYRYMQDPSRYGTAEYYSSPRVTTLAYDPLDRVTRITFPDEETLEYEYDEEGAVTKMTDVHGKVTNYTYYNDGRLYEVILERPAQDDRVFTYTYDDAGRILQIDYPASTEIVVKFSGPSDEDGWDAAGNLLHLRYLLDNSHLHRFAYTYDDSGNRISMLDTPTTTGNAVLWEYGYVEIPVKIWTQIRSKSGPPRAVSSHR